MRHMRITKHETILKYIGGLSVGSRVSVRSIASEMGVSQGTAYRAITEAEGLGLVKAIPRVGTVRIEKMEKKNIETLTYGEIVNIVDGTVLGGGKGLDKSLNKFLIGAMTIDAMKDYMSPGDLMIVGNREEAFRLALERQCAVLITGGFGCSDEIRDMSDGIGLPVISSSYDTFTIATMINKAISENLIKKEIILVEDIVNTDPVYLYADYTIGRCREIMERTGYGKFPVLDEKDRLVGVITTKDLTNSVTDQESVSKVMTEDPVTVTAKASVAYAAHIMVWDSLELIPVVENKKLVGIISRGDVLKALQHVNRQPQVSETIEDMVVRNFSCRRVDGNICFEGRILPEMYGPAGSASSNTLTLLMSTACTIALRQRNHFNIFQDSFTAFYMKPLQVDCRVSIKVRVLESGRNFAKVDAEMCDEVGDLCAKGILSAKIMRNR